MGLNSIQRALDHSAPSNTTPLGANLKLIERARSNRGNTVCGITAACSGGYSKRPIIDPATVQLQNNCTVVGSYAHRLLYSANNRCTISIGNSTGSRAIRN